MHPEENDEVVEAAFRETFIGRPHDWKVMQRDTPYEIELLAKCCRCGTLCRTSLNNTQQFFAVRSTGILTQLEKELARYMYDTDIRNPCRPAVGK